MVSWDTVWDDAIEFAVKYVPNIIGALLILIFGLCIINKVIAFIRKWFKKKGYDQTLVYFILSLIGWILKVVLFLIVIDRLGVEITSMAAILAGISLAIGLAM